MSSWTSTSGSLTSPYTSGSTSVSDTSAIPMALRSRVPTKMTSCMLTPRSVRADCSPNTHEMASEMFDLPQPFGPTMAAMPSPWKRRSVRSQNDLNPRICSFFSLSNVYSVRAPSADSSPAGAKSVLAPGASPGYAPSENASPVGTAQVSHMGGGVSPPRSSQLYRRKRCGSSKKTPHVVSSAWKPHYIAPKMQQSSEFRAMRKEHEAGEPQEQVRV